MEFRNNRIATSVGYSFAFAALCGMALFPQPALADDDADGASSDAAEASSQAGARVNGAPVADEKSETVYIFANPDGSVKETEVSTTLKNPTGEGSLADSSVLTDIENTEGPNTYSGSGDDMVWDTEGKDVYYTGKTDKKAPVSIKVTYYLDGKETPYDKLAGASGKLKIRYDYDNNATVKAKIKGKEETLYVPFTFVTALMFDNDNFKNAEVTNGKLIDDGDRAIVAGYAIPGLQKSLGKMVDDFDIPEYFEVTADVTNFEMKTSLTIVTAGLMSDLNTDEIDTKELRDASGELSDAMSQILDGTGTLADGLNKLADGAKSASKAAGKLADGADKVADGNKELAKGTGKLAKGASQLSDGLSTMQDQTSALPDGVGQLADGATALAGGLADAESGVAAIDSGLNALINGYKDEKGEDHPGLTYLSDQVDKLKGASKELAAAISQLDKAIGGTGEPTNAQALSGQSIDQFDEITGLASQTADLASDLCAQIEALEESSNEVGNSFDSTIENLESAQSALDEIDLEGVEDAETRESIQGQIAKASDSLEVAKNSVGEAKDEIESAPDLADDERLSALASSASELSETANRLVVAADDAAPTYEQLAAQVEQLSKEVQAVRIALEGEGTAENPGVIYASGAISKGIDAVDGGIDKAIDSLNTINKGTSQLNSQLPAATSGARQLSSGLSELASKASALIDGVAKIVTGAKQLDEGTSTLDKGADKLAKGADDLADGANKFDDGLKALPEGAGAAADGAGQLLNGLEEFNEEGIGKITDIIDDDLLPFVDRLDALKDAANDYNNFAGITKGTSGSVKFIIETDAISSEE